MRQHTQDMMKSAIRGVSAMIFAVAIMAVCSAASGDSAGAANRGAAQRQESTRVAGVLLSPRTRLIIDYQRTALA
ncbi:MAG: hypothetical protein H6814_08670 [Phycisphaeraceae bacterium]|nr:hypothetical protein [Phycisphaeraceae bacterium]